MRKRILPWLFLLLIGTALLCPAGAMAYEPLDPDADASLTLRYQKGGVGFENLPIGIYRIAEAFPDATFELIEPYASYPINIHGITVQAQWVNVAQTLYSYIVANNLKPDRTVKTGADGVARFEHLQPGLYYVREAVSHREDGTYVFHQFLVYVPTPGNDGTFNYHVEAKPKCTQYVQENHYTVTKLWQDAGHQDARPAFVTVDLYKDGEWQETQVLNAANNWTYSWSVAQGDTGRWTVTEREVQAPYKVLIRQNGGTFSIINTTETDTTNPDTGDSFSPILWVIILCISGVALLLIGLYLRRHKG